MEIKESDWKIYRQLQPVILDRYCQWIISEIDRVSKQPETSNHDKYLEIFSLMKKHDREIALLFDNTRRSNAIEQLVGLKSRGLIEDEEFAQLGKETQDRVVELLEIFR